MDTDKLVKAIQIIVKEEIKVILPTLVKEGVKKEMAKLLVSKLIKLKLQ